MQYTVVHSTDPYLLARLATDLQMEGVNDKGLMSEITKDMHPFRDNCYYHWLRIRKDGLGLLFICHGGQEDGPRHELTSRNYIKVLTQILEP